MTGSANRSPCISGSLINQLPSAQSPITQELSKGLDGLKEGNGHKSRIYHSLREKVGIVLGKLILNLCEDISHIEPIVLTMQDHVGHKLIEIIPVYPEVAVLKLPPTRGDYEPGDFVRLLHLGFRLDMSDYLKS